MALPRTLKDFNVFYNGNNFIGQCIEFHRPKLHLKLEDYSAAGVGPVKINMGVGMLEAEHTYGGYMRDIVNDFGGKISGVLMRFAGAYQRDDTEEIDAVEIEMMGRHEEIDPGQAKAGKLTEVKVKTAITYYKESINGNKVVEIDLLNKIFFINGTDRWAEIRKAIGQ